MPKAEPLAAAPRENSEEALTGEEGAVGAMPLALGVVGVSAVSAAAAEQQAVSGVKLQRHKWVKLKGAETAVLDVLGASAVSARAADRQQLL